MSTINVLTSDALQPALNRALPGDEIVLQAGVRYVGQFKLPAKSAMVTLRSGGAVIPDVRIGPGHASLLATVASGVGAMALDGYDAKNWQLLSLRFEPNVGGYGEVIGLQSAENVILDQLLLVVPEGQQQKRGILGNGKTIHLRRSHLAGIWRSGQDSQAFAAWDGAGPYFVTDNYLEAASENILFGGADASSDANIPADILIDGNTLTKPLAWKGLPRQVKNLLELKAARRVRIFNNDLSNNWADAQSGFAVLFTPRNQDGTAPFTRVEEVIFERNRMRNVERGFNISGYDDLNTSAQTTGIVIRDNDLDIDGTGCLLHHGAGTVSVYRNTFGANQDRALLSLDRNAHPYAVDDLTWAENTGGGYLHSPEAIGEAALKAYTRQYRLTVEAAPVPVPDPHAVELAKLTAEVAAQKARTDKLIAYLAAAPSATRIAQVVAYLRGAGK